MTLASAPFSAKRFGLVSCELKWVDAITARAISRTLAIMDPWLRLGYTEAGLFRYLIRPDPGLNRYAVMVSGRIAGAICVRYPWLRGPFLEMLAIFPGHQGNRTGRDIITWMKEECCGISNSVWTMVSSFNWPARKFYEKNGFTEIAELPDLVRNGFNEILLQKKCR